MRFLTLFVSLATTAAAQSSSVEHPLMCDLDRDGLPDLYSMAPGRDDVLLRNQGDGRFADVTTECGLGGQRSRAMEPGDFDQDGHADLLLVTQMGELRFFRGATGGVFAEANEIGLVMANVERAEWIDYDRDGWEDLRAEAAHGETVFFHNLEGLGFEKIELGLHAAVLAAAPPAAPTARSEPDAAAPLPGGRVPVKSASPGRDPGGRPARAPVDGGSLALGGGVEEVEIDLVCAEAVRDAANRNDCLRASSTPTMGMLYPLSQDFCVDPATGYVGIGTGSPSAPLTVDGADGIELWDGALRALSLSRISAATGGRVRAFTIGGTMAAEMAAGSPTSGGFLSLRDSGSFGTNKVSLAANGGSGAGSRLAMRDEENRETIHLIGGADAGRVSLRAAVGGISQERVNLTARDTTGGGVLHLLSGQNQRTATLRGGATSGQLVLENDGGAAETVELIGDAGNSEGQIILRDGDGGNDGVALRARHVFGSGEGGVVTVLNGEGQVTARLIGDNGTDQGRMILFEGDGSIAHNTGGDRLRGYDSAGAVTYILNRQSGDASQPVTADGFVKAGCYVIGGAAIVPTQFNNLPGGGTITVTRIVAGAYDVDFGTNISARFPDATLEWSSNGRSIRVDPDGNILHVACYDSAGAFTEGNFWITIR